MEHSGGFLQSIEQSWLGVAARESVWLYPAANVGHVLALTLFAAAVAMMDARLLGAFREVPAGRFLGTVRWLAVAAFLTMLATGSVLFAAEASHVAGNTVFLTKAGLIFAALGNIVLFEIYAGAGVRATPAGAALPSFARISALVSLILWFGVAAAGRLIAYF